MTDLSWEAAGQLPTIPPPPGLIPNFVNSATKHDYDIITQALCIGITTVLIGVRLFTKGVILRLLGWDDWTSVLAWLGLIAYGAVNLSADKYGNGRHLWDVKGDDFTEYMKLTNVDEIIYGPIIFIIKLSIIIQFLRVFAPRKVVRIILHVVLWSNFLFYLAGVFVEIWQCTPRMKIWLPLVPGTCINQPAAQLTAAIFNTISDFAILVIPIISIWDLNLPSKKRWGLVAIFATGSLGCIASTIRMIIIIEKVGHVVLDATWEWYSLNLWSSAEMACGIICGCLPSLSAFIRHFRNQTKPSRRTSSTIGMKEDISQATTIAQGRVGKSAGAWQELREV